MDLLGSEKVLLYMFSRLDIKYSHQRESVVIHIGYLITYRHIANTIKMIVQNTS